MDNSPLLRLPAELRNIIYALAIPKKQIHVTEYQHPMTRVCSQMRRESLPITYATATGFVMNMTCGNHVDFNNMIWLNIQPQAHLDQVKKLIIYPGEASCDSAYRDQWQEVYAQLQAKCFDVSRIEIMMPNALQGLLEEHEVFPSLNLWPNMSFATLVQEHERRNREIGARIRRGRRFAERFLRAFDTSEELSTADILCLR